MRIDMGILLSPLLASNLNRQIARHNEIANDEKDQGKRRRIRIDPVYFCPECGERHDWEDDAIECCAPEEVPSKDGRIPADVCPICGEEHFGDTYSAAECCLWKDTTPAQRFQIASNVERGMDWVEAIRVAA